MTKPSTPSPTSRPVKLAGCVILDDQGRILLIHRNTPKRVHWELSGGKGHPGESAAATAAREIREELDVEVLILRELGTGTFVEDDQEMTYTWLLARIVYGTPRVQEPHIHDEFDYFSREQLREMRADLSSNMLLLLDELDGGHISLDRLDTGRTGL